MEKQKFKYTFTVFTATYNRGHTLDRVYNSLDKQTFKDFEWLIVDDGSTDNTRELVERWQRENRVPIKYYYQENKGKHVAFNQGVREADGFLFLNYDSDDICFNDSLEVLVKCWHQIPESERDEFSAVTGFTVDERQNIIGSFFPVDVIDSNSLEIRLKYKVKGDKWGFQKTQVLREFPFPEISGEKFIPESIVWNRIAKKYKTRYVNKKVLMKLYQNNGLSVNSVKIRVASPKGSRLYYQEYINFQLPIKYKIFGILNYLRFSFQGSLTFCEILRGLKGKNRLLAFFLMGGGYMLYKIDCKKVLKIKK